MKIGIVDTTFARADMGAIALDELRKSHPDVEAERRTVPGFKDLAVECKRMLDAGCDAAIALGMVGGAPVDLMCAHEASLGIQQAKLLTNRHIIEVFVHENEAWSGKEFLSICQDRIRKHVRNAVLLARDPEALIKEAGKGLRQGRENEGPAREEQGIRLGLIVSRFNQEITTKMRQEALKALEGKGATAVVVEVPGVYDMPLVAKKLLMDKRIDAVVALGAVVKGATAHDEVITKDAARRLGDLSLEHRKPVTLGVIGHDVSWEEAEQRAAGYAQRAADAAIYLVGVLRG